MKKIIPILVLFVFCASAFAKVNIRANAIGGPGFVNGKLDVPVLPAISLNADYEFNISQSDSLAAGGMFEFYFMPFIGADFSYIHCLQPQSSNNYRWNLESEIHGGVCFFGNDYVTQDGKIGASWAFYPTVIIDALFTYKPQNLGFYFGVGPSFFFMYMPQQKDFEYMLSPGVMLSAGFRF